MALIRGPNCHLAEQSQCHCSKQKGRAAVDWQNKINGALSGRKNIDLAEQSQLVVS
jgi:hypothetical protein